MLTRRRFLGNALEAAGLVVVVSRGVSGAMEQHSLLINHVGFAPGGGKFCVRAGTLPIPFAIVETRSGNAAHQGNMVVCKGDLGEYLVGDFTALTQAGSYEVRCADAAAKPFTIDAGIYTPSIQKCIRYFAMQRCGDSRTGHHSPCHLDDGRRRDNGKHLDVTGGWHDACDLRKWVNATIYGMIGLSRVLEVLGPKQLDRGRMVEELRWGNSYFLKMQEPDGFVMDYCGGDDGNNYTGNKIGDRDDRWIHCQACELPAQFHFITAQAAMIRLTSQDDPKYARGCEQAAWRCLDWCTKKRSPGAATSLSAGMIACAELHRAVGGDRLQDQAAEYARRLLKLQVTDGQGNSAPLNGFFRTAPDRPEPLREIMHGNLPLLALCQVLEHFPEHPDADNWRVALRQHGEYLSSMSNRSAFGIVPFGLYERNDPGGNRRIGNYWYRWFMQDHDEHSASDWWVGINAHLASNGVGLIKGSRLLEDRGLGKLAQRQLDWILGVNPFDASTVTDVGRNQPRLFVTGEFRPATPLIPGGVMNGLGGTRLDEAAIKSGSWNTCEYWTPMVAYTMWLMSELQKAI